MTDTTGQPSHPPITEGQDAWIDALMREIGLTRAPRESTKIRELEEAFLARMDTELFAKIETKIEADRDKLTDLTRRQSRVTDRDARNALAGEIAELTARIELAEEDLAARRSAGARLAQLTALRKTQAAKVGGLKADIQAGYSDLAERFGDKPRGELLAEGRAALEAGARDWYDGYRKKVADKIETALRASFKVVKWTLPNGDLSPAPIEKEFTEIGPGDYAILQALLAKADLALLREGPDAARHIVDEADYALLEAINARTGEDRPDLEALTGTDLDEELTSISDVVALLQAGRFVDAASVYETALAQFVVYLNGSVSGADTVERCRPEVENWADKAQSAAELVDAVDGHLRDATARLRVFDANGDATRRAEAERAIQGFVRTGTMEACRDRSAALLATVTDLAEACVAAKSSSVDAAVLTQQKEMLAARYEAIKGSTKVPQETKTELSLRLATIDMLLGSGAAEARAQAEAALEVIEDAIDNIESYRDVYKSIDDQLTAAEKELKKNEASYQVHFVSERAEFKTRLEALRADDKTIFQGKLLGQIFAWEGEFVTFQGRCAAEKEAVEGLLKRAKTIEGRFPALATAMRLYQAAAGQAAGIEDYHGAMEGEVAAVRSDLARPSDTAIQAAQATLARIETRIDNLLPLLDRQTRALGQPTSMWNRMTDWVSGGPDRLDAGEEALIAQAVNDAVRGQTEHDERERLKAAFETAAKPFPGQVKTGKAAAGRLGLDGVAIDLVEQEFRALLADAKARQDYAAASRQLEGLKTRLAEAVRALQAEKAEMDATVLENTKAAIGALRDLRSTIAGFFDAAIAARLVPDPSSSAPPVDPAPVKRFLGVVHTALGDGEAGALETAARTITQSDTRGDRLAARKTALRILRGWMAVLDASAAVQHFKAQPFDARERGATDLSRRLTKLEIKYLSAIGRDEG